MNKADLYLGDCYKLLPTLIKKGIKVDLILTDPPYEFHTQGGYTGAFAKRRDNKRLAIENLSKSFDFKIFKLFKEICPSQNYLIWCSNKQISRLMSYFEKQNLNVTLLVWYKPNSMPLGNWAYISDLEFCVFVRGQKAHWNNKLPANMKSKHFTCGVNFSEVRYHPTQKPIAIMDRLINLHSFKDDTILDCFMGSGSTGVSAVKNGRNFIGIEQNEKYYEIAQQRINAENNQTRLFV